MECKYCQQKCSKAGTTANTIQRYYCKPCNKYQQLEYDYLGCSKRIESRVVELNNEGCGIRSISRILQISPGKVLSTIKKVSKEIRSVRSPIVMGREYELDEMKTFIKKKNKKYWVVYAIDRLTREVVDFRIIKNRTNKKLKPVIETLLLRGAKKIYTDKLKQYASLIPAHLHVKSRYKINRIERKNLNVRMHLKRLSRKTICFSRSKEMLEACVAIYFFRNQYSC
ncbi:MAG: transposase [Chitinophagaceae bacterium]|nr:transposase [Chitinophagaceae bacterium]